MEAKKTSAQTNNSEIATHLNAQGAKQNLVTSFEQRAREWFSINCKKLRTLCGSNEDAGRLLTAAINSLQKTPSLIECSFESWTSCLLQSAEYRLYPGAMQECAYVPFNNSKKGCKEATFMLQYQGICQLLFRSGMIKDIEAEVVCEKDHFIYKRGSSRSLSFEPFDGDRGEWIGVYCIIRNIFGGEHIVYMTAHEVYQIKERSRASASKDSPWNSPYESDQKWMWKKTAVKQCAKLTPRSATMSSLIAEAFSVDVESDDGFEKPKPIKMPDSIALPEKVSPIEVTNFVGKEVKAEVGSGQLNL